MSLAARLLLLGGLWGLALPAGAAVTIDNLRQWQAPDNTRLVFDLSGPVEHRLHLDSNPPRLVVDLDNAQLRERLPALETQGSWVAAMQTSRHNGGLRVTFELRRDVRPRSFVLKPAGPYGHRLVVDLYDAAETEDGARKPPAPAERRARREVVIAIDAGHGGEDPGAVGRRYRTREKDVTLAIARELARQVNEAPGLKAVLIRDGDYYVSLDRRFKKARDRDADVFISIHADSFPGRRQAKGSSVYALSERGASHAFAKSLADRENFADLVGGVSLNDKADDVRKTLLDLSLSKQIEHSLLLGGDILTELRGVGPVHLGRVAQAGFAVLKSPDVPSVLVETAFISNPTEEKKLRTPAFQRQLASGILAGLRRYVARRPAEPAAGTVVAQPAPGVVDTPVGERQHVVRGGETLSSIARRYGVHVDVLRFFNQDLQESDLPIGLRLRIPPAESDS